MITLFIYFSSFHSKIYLKRKERTKKRKKERKKKEIDCEYFQEQLTLIKRKNYFSKLKITYFAVCTTEIYLKNIINTIFKCALYTTENLFKNTINTIFKMNYDIYFPNTKTLKLKF